MSTAASNNQQDEFGMAPDTEPGKAKCSTAAFPKLCTFRKRAGFSCYNVTTPPPCSPPYIKDSLKEDAGDWLRDGGDWLGDGLIGWL
jgi:hypothetical protein